MAILVGVVKQVERESRQVTVGEAALRVPDAISIDAFVAGLSVLIEVEALHGVIWVTGVPRYIGLV